MIKHLVTSGCSFSECVNWDRDANPDNRTWPIFLRERMPEVQHWSEGMGSQGNDLIDRRVHYRVNQLLKQVSSQDILVAVMWTGQDRFGFYFNEPIQFTSNLDGWIENPTRVVDDAPGGWVICNPHWTHAHNSAWYRHYYNETAAQIYTLEHIINLQNYLKLKQVRYFMTSSFSTHINEYEINNDNCRWLYDQIDWDQWLPVESEKHWVDQNCAIPGANNYHPRPNQHEQFVDQVIMPWLASHKLLTSV